MNACIFSPKRLYRYSLVSIVGTEKKICLFICLNPSTADETRDDNTVRRCKSYAKQWGYGVFSIANIFAYRATNPKELYKANNPIGLDNDRYIRESAECADLIVAAWGNHGQYLDRGRHVLTMLREVRKPVHTLGLTRSGQPRHPLYLAKDTELQECANAIYQPVAAYMQQERP